MNQHRAFVNLGLAILLSFGLCILMGRLIRIGEAAPPPRLLDAPSNPTPSPAPNDHTVPLTVPLALTYDETIDPATVSTRTFTVYAEQTGLLPGTYGANSSTIIMTPTEPLKPGELVQVSATTGTLSLVDGKGPTTPTVWQFRAAAGTAMGVFSKSDRVLGSSTARVVELADLDGDGDLDVFVGNYADANQIWWNEGRGLYTDSGQRLGSTQTNDAALGDLDRDGDLDAFIANYSEANRVWLNDSHGVLTDSNQALGSSDTYAVALGDVDGDGDLDALTANQNQPNRLWLNDGSGLFTDSGQALGTAATYAVALGDVDGDGDLDAFTGNAHESNRLWLNDGTGLFADSNQSMGSGSTNAVALGDLDGDGDVDAFIGNRDQPNCVWLNDGSGLYSDSGQALASAATHAVALGDVEGDGDLDVFAGNYNQPNRIWLNDGSASFTDSGQSLASAATFAVALGDVDDDGDLDGLAGNYNQADRVWLNDVFMVTATSPTGNGATLASTDVVSTSFNLSVDSSTLTTRTFAVRGRQSGVYEGTYTSEPVQFDGTDNFKAGEAIVVTLNDGIRSTLGSRLSPYTWQFHVTPSESSGSFGDGAQFHSTGYIADIALGDLDNDGDLDAYLAENGANQIWLNLGGDQAERSGNFTVTTQSLGNGSSRAVALGDLNGDGSLDAFVGNGTDASGESNRVWFNEGSNTFTDSGQSLGISQTTAIDLGDLDGDGDLDAVVGNFQEADRIWLNEGGLQGGIQGVFQATNQHLSHYFDPITSWTTAIKLGDLDADGDLDLFVGSYDGGNTVWFNDGTGRFTDSGQEMGMEYTEAISLGDLDGDHDLDAFIGNGKPGIPEANEIWINDGAGTFTDSGQRLGVEETYDVSLADVDGDGDLDAFAANSESSIVWINSGGQQGGSVGLFVNSGQVVGIHRVADLGDVDQDGDVDVLGPSGTSNVWLNALRDLTITEMSVEPRYPDISQIVTASIVIKNQGTGEITTPFITAIYSDHIPTVCDGGATAWATDVITRLSAGTSTTLTIVLPGFSAAGRYNLSAHTDVDCTSDDLLGNNIFDPMVITVDPFTVTETFPPDNGRSFVRDGVLSATFDQTLDITTVNSRTFTVWGDQTGSYRGNYSFNPLQFDAAAMFKPGESIQVGLSENLLATDGSRLIPHAWKFRAAVDTGTGVFSDTFQALASTNTYAVALGDVDGDGDLDALSGGFTSTLWLNQGGLQSGNPGSLSSSAQVLDVGRRVNAVLLTDLDNDEDLDLVLGTYGANAVFLNDGSGTFTNSGQSLGSASTDDLAAGDLDGDGDIDLYAANSGPDAVWSNDGRGVFTPNGYSLPDLRTSSVALGDVDGDGDLDALIGHPLESDEIRFNNGLGYFTASNAIDTAANTSDVALEDVNADGYLDILIARTIHDGLRIWFNDGTGAFVAGDHQTLSDYLLEAIALGDIDGDGDLDLFGGFGGIETDFSDQIWLNGENGDAPGQFSDSGQRLGAIGTGDVALGDLDLDGDLDAFIAHLGGSDTVWFNNKNSPVAYDDQFAAPPDSAGNRFGVLGNDVDCDGDSLSIANVGYPAHGTASTDGNVVVYTPTLGFNGTDVFTYTVTDPGLQTDTGTVTVTVGAGSAPIAANDERVTDEDISVTIDALTNDVDPEGQTLFIQSVDRANLGTVTVMGDQLNYEPDEDANGLDVFSYTVSDGWFTDTALITVTIHPIEDPPTLTPIADQNILEDAQSYPVSLSNITSGAFNETQALTVTAQTYIGESTLPDPVVNYNSANTTGTLLLTPSPNKNGLASVRVTVNDGIKTVNDTFLVTVEPVNDPPSASEITTTTREDSSAMSIRIIPDHTSDIDEDLLAITDLGAPSGGQVSMESSEVVAYQPLPDWNGLDVFTYTVADPGGLRGTGAVTVNVTSIEDRPTLDAITDVDIDEDETYVVSLSGITSGAANEDQNLVLTAVSTETTILPHPTVSYLQPESTGSLRLSPSANRFGVAGVTVTVTDGVSQTHRAFEVWIKPINDPPTLDSIGDITVAMNTVSQTVELSSISSGPYESQTLNLTASTDNPSLLTDPQIIYNNPDNTAQLILTPKLDQWGWANVNVKVDDGLTTTLRSFQLTVKPDFLVVGTTPSGNGALSPSDGPEALLTRTVNNPSITDRTLIVYGEQTGAYAYTYTIGSTLYHDVFTFGTLEIDPISYFKPGERILIDLTDGIESGDDERLAPYQWEFRAPVKEGSGIFDVADIYNVSSISPLKITESYQPHSVLDSQAVALGDLDGDGDLDAYVARNSARSTVWFNDGTGSFTDSGQNLGDDRSWSVALGDLDSDTDLDALVGNYGGPSTLWLNDGAGTFIEAPHSLEAGDTYAIALGDVDGDGDLDVVTGTDLGQANHLWINDGTGTFTRSKQYLGYWDTRALGLGDMDNDGDPDLLFGNSSGEANRLWFNDGHGNFTDSGQTLGSAQTYAVDLGDLDGDADLDLFVGNLAGEPDEVWFNDGTGTLIHSGQQLGHWATWALDLGDVDADGDLDAVTGQVRWEWSGSERNRVWVNDGNGHFSTNQGLGEWDSLSIALGDVESDGDLDIFVGNSNGLNQPNTIYRNRSLSVQISADKGGTLSYGNPESGDRIVWIPPGAVDTPTEIRMTNDPTDPPELTGEDRTSILNFALDAYRQDAPMHDLTFSTPMTITLRYSDAGIGDVDESTLSLWAWDGTAWSTEDITVVEHDPAFNHLIVQATRSTEYILRGHAIYRTYLPLAMRAHMSTSANWGR